jgi:hypothetical protein
MKWMLPVLFFAALACTGCVERRIYLISDPPGADVYIDGEYVGQTRPKDHPQGPLYANFIYYGQREYTFRKPGYATQSGTVKLETPWYEYPPVDFFVDEHFVEVKLERARPADVEALYQAARHYRATSRPQDRYEFAQARFVILKPRPPLPASPQK